MKGKRKKKKLKKFPNISNISIAGESYDNCLRFFPEEKVKNEAILKIS